MSFYNLVHGVNPLTHGLLAALNIESSAVPRFRDCYWNGTHIVVYTRTGGGNREYYDSKCDDNPDGPWNDTLRSVPGYSHDEDDDSDSTYASFYFTPTESLRDALAGFQAADATPAQKWEAFLDRLKSGDQDEQIARVTNALKPLVDAVKGHA